MPWSGSIRRDQAGLPPAPCAVVDVRARPVLRRPGIRPFAAHERVVTVQHSPMRRAGICAQIKDPVNPCKIVELGCIGLCVYKSVELG